MVNPISSSPLGSSLICTTSEVTLMHHASRQTVKVACDFFANNAQFQQSISSQILCGRNKNLIESISNCRRLVYILAKHVSQASSHILLIHKKFAVFFIIDAGLFNILSLFRKGMSFSCAVKETVQFWQQGKLTDRLNFLTDAAFKGLTLGEAALQLVEKVSLVVMFIALSLPLACIALITTTITAIKALVTTIRFEQKRSEFLGCLGNKTKLDRFNSALEYCKGYESEIDLDNTHEEKRLLASGSTKEAIRPFLDARKKWALTGLFGSISYHIIFQEFKRIDEELKRISKERDSLVLLEPSEASLKHLEFMNQQYEKLVTKASSEIDKFVSNLGIERTQLAASCIALSMMVVVTAVSLAAFFVSIKYLVSTLVILIIISSFITMVNSFYNLWAQKDVTWIEKENALNLMTAHFTERMRNAKTNEKAELSKLFDFTIPNEIRNNEDLVVKEFEEYLKDLLHDEKVERYINRAFVKAIQNQFKTRSKRKNLSSQELAKFEKNMMPFLKIIMAPPEKQILKRLESISITSNEEKTMEEKLGDAFFFYLNRLNEMRLISP